MAQLLDIYVPQP